MNDDFSTPPQPSPCPCNKPTCHESWEPGCGLGNSREHAQPTPAPVQERYVTFDDAGIHVDISRWLKSDKGKEAVKRIAGSTQPAPAADGAGDHIAMLRSLRLMYADEPEGEHLGTIAALDAAIAALRQPVDENAREVAKLVEFFRNEGYLPFGLEGDNRGWTPAETAIAAMRKIIASQQESRND